MAYDTTCKNCGKPFHARKRSGRVPDHSVYCSKSCAKVGRPSNARGFRHTDETRLKNSLGHLGKKMGKDHPRWTGNSTQDHIERSRFRQYTQKKVFERDNYTCQICEQRGGYLQVHHKNGWKESPELRFDIDNCQTLCMACHYYLTFKKKLTPGTVWGHNMCKRVAS